MSETNINAEIMLESSQRGTPLLRNNSGVLPDRQGRPVRFGLGNESKEVNKIFKSSDLIGIYPVRITQEMVGSTVGLFFAVESKKPGWRFDERAQAQQNFGRWVQRHGGLFTFATGPGDVWS